MNFRFIVARSAISSSEFSPRKIVSYAHLCSPSESLTTFAFHDDRGHRDREEARPNIRGLTCPGRPMPALSTHWTFISAFTSLSNKVLAAAQHAMIGEVPLVHVHCIENHPTAVICSQKEELLSALTPQIHIQAGGNPHCGDLDRLLSCLVNYIGCITLAVQAASLRGATRNGPCGIGLQERAS